MRTLTGALGLRSKHHGRTLSLLLAGSFVALTVWAATPLAPPVFQIRLVVDSSSDDSESMPLVSKTRQEVVQVQKTILFDHRDLRSAEASIDEDHPVIAITFTEEGRRRFAECTRQNVGKRLAIILAGRLYCAPRIRDEIPGGKAVITGEFSVQEAGDLAARISRVIDAGNIKP